LKAVLSPKKLAFLCAVSGFRRCVNQISALLGFNAASNCGSVTEVRIAFTFNSQERASHLKIKAILSFEMAGASNPETQHHIPEDLNPNYALSHFSFFTLQLVSK
jgi:hypothetical protein